MKEQKKKSQLLPSMTGLIIRIVASAYVIYLACQLFAGGQNSEGTQRIIYMAIAILFIIACAGIIYITVMAYKRGEYIGGAADPDIKSEDSEDDDSDPNGTFKGAGAESEDKPKRIKFGEREE